MGYDYKAFADGQLAEVLAGNRERTVWAKKAGELEGRLRRSRINVQGEEISAKAWLEVAKLMREEIAAFDPSSPLANKDYLNQLYNEKRTELADGQGFYYDEDGCLEPKP